VHLSYSADLFVPLVSTQGQECAHKVCGLYYIFFAGLDDNASRWLIAEQCTDAESSHFRDARQGVIGWASFHDWGKVPGGAQRLSLASPSAMLSWRGAGPNYLAD
jgi:hypothetical protein